MDHEVLEGRLRVPPPPPSPSLPPAAPPPPPPDDGNDSAANTTTASLSSLSSGSVGPITNTYTGPPSSAVSSPTVTRGSNGNFIPAGPPPTAHANSNGNITSVGPPSSAVSSRRGSSPTIGSSNNNNSHNPSGPKRRRGSSSWAGPSVLTSAVSSPTANSSSSSNNNNNNTITGAARAISPRVVNHSRSMLSKLFGGSNNNNNNNNSSYNLMPSPRGSHGMSGTMGNSTIGDSIPSGLSSAPPSPLAAYPSSAEHQSISSSSSSSSSLSSMAETQTASACREQRASASIPQGSSSNDERENAEITRDVAQSLQKSVPIDEDELLTRLAKDEAFQGKLSENCKRLEQATDQFYMLLPKYLSLAPVRLRLFTRAVLEIVESKFPGFGSRGVGALLFLRLLCPALMESYWFEQVIDREKKDQCRRHLLLITKLMQNIANGVRFGAKEKFMVRLNPYIEANL
eukprot:g81731.t1